jgi:hypothetical protein
MHKTNGAGASRGAWAQRVDGTFEAEPVHLDAVNFGGLAQQGANHAVGDDPYPDLFLDHFAPNPKA